MTLVAEGICKRYAGLQALDHVSVSVGRGEIVGLIGSNGAGKTTLFEVLSGLRDCDEGAIRIGDTVATDMPPWDRCRCGLGRTFQIVKPLPRLSTLDNVKIGALVRHKDPSVAEEKALEALAQVGLEAHGNRLAGELTLLDLKRLEIARALATDPQYLLLDECFAGLRAGEQDESIALIKALADEGIGFLLIEHSMRMVMNVVDRVVVLHHGRELAAGLPSEVVANADVQAAYLGLVDATS